MAAGNMGGLACGVASGQPGWQAGWRASFWGGELAGPLRAWSRQVALARLRAAAPGSWSPLAPGVPLAAVWLPKGNTGVLDSAAVVCYTLGVEKGGHHEWRKA